MNNRGVQEFYFTRALPSRAVAIAKIATAAATPAQLTDVQNTPYGAGSFGVWNGSVADEPDFVAKDYGVPVTISGSSSYGVTNPFFELTNKVATTGTPLFYKHTLPTGVTDVKILDLAGRVVPAEMRLVGNVLYHNLDGGAYRVRYADGTRVFVKLLRYDLAMSRARYANSANTYLSFGSTFQVSGTPTLYLRFTRPNGYRIYPPYTALPNTPWFVRIGTSVLEPAPEWARQVFLPERPYMLAAWVPGVVLDAHLIEFERKRAFDDPQRRPDILVFDKDYKIKYALEGSGVGTERRRGSVYRWKRGQIDGFDPYTARVEVKLELASTDIVYGFYPYQEPDVLYTGLDLNPFTNPSIKNRVVRFYYRDDSDPFHRIYHQVFEADGVAVPGLTNDPDPPTELPNVFGELIVGASVGVPQVTVTDVRTRGGGLGPLHQTVPEAVNFWDLGYWDGKPYPIGAALAVYLPSRILETLSREDVQAKVNAVLPLGVTAIVRYYDDAGEEVL